MIPSVVGCAAGSSGVIKGILQDSSGFPIMAGEPKQFKIANEKRKHLQCGSGSGTTGLCRRERLPQEAHHLAAAWAGKDRPFLRWGGHYLHSRPASARARRRAGDRTCRSCDSRFPATDRGFSLQAPRCVSFHDQQTERTELLLHELRIHVSRRRAMRRRWTTVKLARGRSLAVAHGRDAQGSGGWESE